MRSTTLGKVMSSRNTVGCPRKDDSVILKSLFYGIDSNRTSFETEPKGRDPKGLSMMRRVTGTATVLRVVSAATELALASESGLFSF